MKHVSAVTKGRPTKANAIQDIICEVSFFMGQLLGAFGGSAPFLGFVNEKCDLPRPGDGDTTA